MVLPATVVHFSFSSSRRADHGTRLRSLRWINVLPGKFSVGVKERRREPSLTIVNAGLPRLGDHGIMRMRNSS